MELINGKSLKEVLSEEGKLTINRAVTLCVEMCRGVSFAHQKGVIHRDIKPDNIMIIPREGERPENVKVLDFGLAKMRESEDQSSITHIGTVMGTPLYMSPEQCRGEELDARSDVYSLTAVLFEMISGSPPFSGSDVCSKHQHQPVPAFDSSLNVAQAIVDVINQGLAKDREDRHPDVHRFSQDLQNAYALGFKIPPAAPLAETLVDQKSLVIEESALIPGLTRVDTLVLKTSCELALETGFADVLYTSKLLEALQQLGIAGDEVWESLEQLDERRFIDVRHIRGSRTFQVYSLRPQGFHEYAKIFISDYNGVTERIIHSIGVDEQVENVAISEAVRQPTLLVNFILDLLEGDGLLTQHKGLGGKSSITRVTVDLKRRARELDARYHHMTESKFPSSPP